MNLKKVLACTLIGISIFSTANVVTAHASDDAPVRKLGRTYEVDVIWDPDLNRIVIADKYYYSIKDLCNEVIDGTCMVLDSKFHNILHDKRIDHKCPWDD